jgi:hypothetical protein
MRSLDPCPSCTVGKMLTYRTLILGSSKLRYLRCSHCGRTGKEQFQCDSLGRRLIASSSKENATTHGSSRDT